MKPVSYYHTTKRDKYASLDDSSLDKKIKKHGKDQEMWHHVSAAVMLYQGFPQDLKASVCEFTANHYSSKLSKLAMLTTILEERKGAAHDEVEESISDDVQEVAPVLEEAKKVAPPPASKFAKMAVSKLLQEERKRAAHDDVEESISEDVQEVVPAKKFKTGPPRKALGGGYDTPEITSPSDEDSDEGIQDLTSSPSPKVFGSRKSAGTKAPRKAIGK